MDHMGNDMTLIDFCTRGGSAPKAQLVACEVTAPSASPCAATPHHGPGWAEGALDSHGEPNMVGGWSLVWGKIRKNSLADMWFNIVAIPGYCIFCVWAFKSFGWKLKKSGRFERGKRPSETGPPWWVLVWFNARNLNLLSCLVYLGVVRVVPF